MSSSQLSGSYGYIDLTTSTYANPVTVTSTGAVAGGPTQDGLLATTAWTIVNDGSISGGLDGIDLKGGAFGNSAALSGAVDNTGSIHGGNDGVYLYAGGAVTNAAGGAITGGNAGVNVGGGSVYNVGSISGGNDGVYLFGGGVTNAAGGSITGGIDGVLAKDAAGYVSNAGYIGGGAAGVDLQFGLPGEPSGTVYNTGTIHGGQFGVYLYSDGIGVGGYVSNGASGTITAGGQAVAVGSGGIVNNAGLIAGGAAGVYIFEGGAVGNAAGGTITGGVDGVLANDGAAGVLNAGYIGGGAEGVDLQFGAPGETSGVVENIGTIHGANYGVYLYVGGVVINFAGGVITAGATGVAVGGGATVYNAGSIGGGASGLYLYGGAALTNAAGGLITGGVDGVLAKVGAGAVYNAGYIGGGVEGVDLQFGAPGEISGTVDNTGTIQGSKYGVYLYVGGAVVNDVGGLISAGRDGVDVGGGATVYNAGSIGGGAHGVFIYQGGALTNAAGGKITGGSDGVYVNVETGTVDNAGSIGGGGDGVDLTAGGVVSNAAGGKIGGGAYGVDVSGATATVYNAGMIGGGADAIELGASISNLLIVDAGAVFDGKVIATDAGATNTIELTSSASAGTLSGLGREFQGFQDVTIDAGAHWDVKGLKSAFADTTISGFNGHDALDLTNLTYASGATAVLTGDTLAVTSDGMTVDITMIDTTGMHFYAHDVRGDVLVNEKPACYLRGTLILTDRGEVAVEDLAVGDRVVTLSGDGLSFEDRPIRWIGRRSYAGWAAAGNPGVQPILFKAGSLADHVPSRDLLVSPEHAMYLDGALIPARLLVNGQSIVKAGAMDEIHYFHLELERHAVIFAEDAASETYVDDDNRGMFHNVYEYYAEHPEATRGLRAEYCAPRVEDGFALEAARNMLMARALRLRPDGTATPVPALGGQLDLVSRTLIEGWAFAPDTPDEAVALVILDNGAIIGEVTADRYRADLEACGIGDGRHAFRLALPRGLAPEFRHLIEVRRESDWTLLPGSGKVLKPRALAA